MGNLGRQLVCAVAHEFINRGIFLMLLFGDAKKFLKWIL